VDPHFDPAPTEAWWKAIDRELKGNPRSGLFVDWTPDAQSPPFHDWSTPRPTEPLFAERYWGVTAEVGGTESQINTELLDALNRGADHLLLDLRPHYRLETVLEGVQIELLRTELIVEGDPRPMARQWTELCDHRGLDPASMRAGINFDPWEVQYRTGKPALGEAEVREIVVALSQHPGFDRSLAVNTAIYAERGAGPALQLAIALATAQEIVRTLGDCPAHRFWFGMANGPDFLVETAKLRAFRALWAHFIQAHQTSFAPAHLLCETARRGWSALDPHGNLIRATTQGLSGVLGGADEVLMRHHWLSSAPASEHHLDFQLLHLIRYEAQFNLCGDVLAGAYTVEYLTETLAGKAWERFLEIERQGGLEKVIEQGLLSEWIRTEAAEEQARFEQGLRPVIGSSVYPHRENGIDLDALGRADQLGLERLAAAIERQYLEAR